MRSVREEFLRYLVCSALALAADFSCYSLCLSIGTGYPVAAALGFVLGLAIAYSTSVRFAFRARAVSSRRVEFGLFAGIGILGLLLTEALLWLLITRLGIDAQWAKLMTAGAVFIFNFSLRKLALFTQRSAKAAP